MDITLKSNNTLEFDKVKEELAKCAKFEQSRNLCLRLKTFDDAKTIKQQIELTREAKKYLITLKILLLNILQISLKLKTILQYLTSAKRN